VTFRRFVDGVQWLVAALAALTVILLLVAQPSEASGAAPDLGEGATVFASNCAGCHGSDGSGGVGPALVGEDVLARFVSVGVPGRMPGFETRLTPEEIDAVAGLVFSGLGS